MYSRSKNAENLCICFVIAMQYILLYIVIYYYNYTLHYFAIFGYKLDINH